MKNPDTRVRYTRAALRHALLELLKEKGIDKITVKEICERAKLNRGTFYLHYESPAGLLKDIENEFAEESTRFFRSFWQEGREVSIMEAMFACVKENSDVFSTLMGPNGDPGFFLDYMGGMREYVLNQWQEEFPHYSREHLDFIYDFVSAGSTQLILRWLQDSRGITASEFARRVERMGHHALMAIEDF